MAVEPESEGMKAQNRRNGAPQGAHFKFRKRFSAPRPLIAPGRQAAEGFGVGESLLPFLLPEWEKVVAERPDEGLQRF